MKSVHTESRKKKMRVLQFNAANLILENRTHSSFSSDWTKASESKSKGHKIQSMHTVSHACNQPCERETERMRETETKQAFTIEVSLENEKKRNSEKKRGFEQWITYKTVQIEIKIEIEIDKVWKIEMKHQLGNTLIHVISSGYGTTDDTKPQNHTYA